MPHIQFISKSYGLYFQKYLLCHLPSLSIAPLYPNHYVHSYYCVAWQLVFLFLPIAPATHPLHSSQSGHFKRYVRIHTCFELSNGFQSCLTYKSKRYQFTMPSMLWPGILSSLVVSTVILLIIFQPQWPFGSSKTLSLFSAQPLCTGIVSFLCLEGSVPKFLHDWRITR